MKVMSGLLTATIVICTAIGATVCGAQQAPNYREYVAVRLWEQLYTLPDNPRATSAAQNVLMKKQAARVLVQEYALRKKLNIAHDAMSGTVDGRDMQAALRELDLYAYAFAQKQFPNMPGENPLAGEYEPFNWLMHAMPHSQGLTALREMILQYSRP